MDRPRSCPLTWPVTPCFLPHVISEWQGHTRQPPTALAVEPQATGPLHQPAAGSWAPLSTRSELTVMHRKTCKLNNV